MASNGTKTDRRAIAFAMAAFLCVSLVLFPGRSFVHAEENATAVPDAGAEALVEKLSDEKQHKQVELDQLQNNIALSKEKVDSLQAEIETLSGNTANLKQALVESADRRRALEAKVGESESQIEKLAGQEKELRAALNRERDVLADVLAALQRMGRDPPPALLVAPGDALDSVRSAILLNGVVPEMRTKMEGVLADLHSLQDVKHAQEETRDKLAGDLDTLAEEDRRMDMLIAENIKASNKNAAELAAEQAKAEALAARAGDLNSLIASLETEIGSARNAALLAREEAEERARMSAAQRRQARDQALSGMPDKNRISPAYPFSDLKSRLALPVEGEILRGYGDPDGTGHEATGITIAARPGALVTAPSDGTVVYAGRFRSYGEMIILNVGDGYHIVMTGMDGLKVHQGDFVFSGEPLAEMGMTHIASAATLALETDRPTLYIEFRHNGKPVDSHSWWAVKNDGKARNGS